MESQKIKKENEDSWQKYKKEYYDEVRFVKVEKIDVDECSYAEGKPEKVIVKHAM